MKLKKITAIEPVSLLNETKKEIEQYFEEAIFYDTLPRDEEEIADRIGDSDVAFVSYRYSIGESVLKKCKNLKYIGMCCSLYSEASSNVDIRYARQNGICVKGVRDYGDQGVAEYVIGEVIRMLQGTGGHAPFLGQESEVSGIRAGILGMGASAQAVAAAFVAFGADVSYYSRTIKKELEEKNGYHYLELDELLTSCNVICSCLSKNVILLHEREMKLMGKDKILFNTALSPCFDAEAMKKWLTEKNTWYFCDTLMGLGEEELLQYGNVSCLKKSSGMTKQAVKRLNEKVLINLKEFLEEEGYDH